MIDLLIRDAELFDGSGAPPLRADVAVVDGRIARIAPRIGDAEAPSASSRPTASR